MDVERNLLLVEDDPLTRNHLRRLFSSPPRELAERHGLAAFAVTDTDNAEGAWGFLEEARRTFRPFDVIVYDLELPPRAGQKARLEAGLDLLKRFDERIDGTLVIESAYGTNDVLIKLLRLGRAYFVPKIFTDEAIFAAAAQAFRSGRQHLDTRAAALLAERTERWSLVQSRTQIADCMARTVTEGISRVIEVADHLKELIQDRWQLHLEQDQDDPVNKALAELRTAALETAAGCAQVRQPAVRDSGAFQQMVVEQVLTEVVQRLRDVIAFRRVTLGWPADSETKVSSFPADVKMVVEEMVCAAVQASGQGQTVEVTIGRSEDGLTVNIAVEDQAEIKPDEAVQLARLTEGTPVEPGAGRAWGLFLARHAALNIGAKVQIEPASTAQAGTKSVLQIPVTAND